MSQEPFEPHTHHPGHNAEDEEGEEHEHGLSHTFLEKVIHLPSMDPALVVLTVTAVVVVALCAILLVFHTLPMPRAAVGLNGTPPFTPLPILIATTIFMTLAWSYILVGALHAHIVLRVIALLVYSAVMIEVPLVSGSLYGALGGILILLAVWAMAITLSVTDRIFERGRVRLPLHRDRLRISVFLFFTVATLLFYAIAGVRDIKGGDFGAFVWLQLAALQFALIPMLYLAGTDFAEWAEVLSGRVGAFATSVAGKRSAWVLAAIVFVGAALILVQRYEFYSWRGMLTLGGEASVALLLMAAVGWAAVRRRAAAEIPFGAMVAVALLGVGSIIIGSALASFLAPKAPAEAPKPGGYVAYSHTEKPVFTIEQPEGWTPSTEHPAGGPAVVFRGSDVSGLPVRFVVLTGEATASGPELISERLPAVLGGDVAVSGEARVDGQWQAQDLTLRARPTSSDPQGTAFEGTAWTRTEGSERWLLVGVSPVIAGGSYEPQFAHMIEGWKPEAAKEGSGGEGGKSEVEPFAYVYTIGPIVWLIAFAVGIFLIVRGGRAATAGLYLVCGGILFLGYGLYAMFGWVTGHQLPRYWAVDMESVTMVVAAVAVVGVVVLAVTGRLTARYVPLLRLTLVLLLGLVLLKFLYDGVFTAALNAGKQFSLVQALVLLLALLWDTVMSGENLTNRHGRHIPRHSRVLLFFGYVMLVATAVLFLNTLTGAGEGSEFESDTWPQLGIQLMGLPLLITFFFVNFGAWLRRGRAAEGGVVDRAE